MKQLILLFISITTLFSTSFAQKEITKPIEFVYELEWLDSLTLDFQMFPGDVIIDIDHVHVPLEFTVSERGIIDSIIVNDLIITDLTGFSGKSRNKKILEYYFADQAKYICKLTEGLWYPAQKDSVYVSSRFSHVFKFQVKRDNRIARRKVYFGGNNYIDPWYQYDKLDKKVATDRAYDFVRKYHKDLTTAKRYHKNSSKYITSKRYYLAELLLDLSEEQNPGDVNMLYDRGIVKLFLGKNEEACFNF